MQHARNMTMSQIDGIAAYINSGKALTSMEALTNFGCFRLAARIKELKDRRNMVIITTIKTNPVSKNKYASYSLAPQLEMRSRVKLARCSASAKAGLHAHELVPLGTIGRVTALSDRSVMVQFTGFGAVGSVIIRKEDLELVASNG